MLNILCDVIRECQEKWSEAVRTICGVGVYWLFARDVWGYWRLKIRGWNSSLFGRQDELVVLVAERLEGGPIRACSQAICAKLTKYYFALFRCNRCCTGWLGSRVVSVLDSGAVGPGFKSQLRRCRVTVLGKLFTPIVHLFTKQRNW